MLVYVPLCFISLYVNVSRPLVISQNLHEKSRVIHTQAVVVAQLHLQYAKTFDMLAVENLCKNINFWKC